MSDNDTYRYNEYPGSGEVSQLTLLTEPYWECRSESFLWSPLVTLRERKSVDVPGSRKTWKPFEHYKLVTGLPSSGQKVRWTSSQYSWDYFTHIAVGEVSYPTAFYNGEFGVPGEPIAGLPALYSPSMDGHFVPVPADLAFLLDDAMKSIIPRIKTDVSLINSIYELKDFRSWGTAIKRGMTMLQRWSSVMSALNKMKGSTLRDKSRVAAAAYLQYKFNVAPLLSDIQGVYNTLNNNYRRMNKAIAEQGRPRVGHYMVELNEGLDAKTEQGAIQHLAEDRFRNGWSSTCQSIMGTSRSERFVSRGSSLFHVEVLYSVRYTDLQASQARLLSILDSLGINLNPAIIWNAIPWSFVVDWVAGVSRFLDNFRMGFMDPALCIHKALWSIKRTRSILVQTKVQMTEESGRLYPPEMLVHPLTVETAYRRQLFSLMDVVTRLKTSGLNATELSLAGALAMSRRPRKRNWRTSR